MGYHGTLHKLLYGFIVLIVVTVSAFSDHLDWDFSGAKTKSINTTVTSLEQQFRPEFLKDPLDIVPPDSHHWNSTTWASNFECQYPNFCDTYFNDSQIAQEFIYNHQNPPDCSNARFLVIPHEHPWGMGSSIHVKAFFIGLAVRENRVLIQAHDNAYYKYGRLCDPPTMECIFEPMTNCSTKLHAPNWQTAPLLVNVTNNLTDVRVVRLKDGYTGSENWPQGYDDMNYIPPPFSHKDKYWWHAQVSYYIARPNNTTKDIVERYKRFIFPPFGHIPHPMISMFVQDMEKIQPIAEKYNITNVYLGTDDAEVVKLTQNYTNYKFYYILTVTANESANNIINSNYGDELVRVSLANLYISILGDIFVGTRSSNFCRLIDEFRKVEGKARVPYLTPEPEDQFFREVRYLYNDDHEEMVTT